MCLHWNCFLDKIAGKEEVIDPQVSYYVITVEGKQTFCQRITLIRKEKTVSFIRTVHVLQSNFTYACLINSRTIGGVFRFSGLLPWLHNIHCMVTAFCLISRRKVLRQHG